MVCPLRVLLIDDHTIVRRGIRALLAAEPNIEVVGEAANDGTAVAAVTTHRPDVIVIDPLSHDGSDITAIERIRATEPNARILVLTSDATDEGILPAIRAGVLGYMLNEITPEELVVAINQVARGESALHPVVGRRILQEFAQPTQDQPISALTEREIAILRLVARGLSNRDLAEALRISEPTARTHVSNVLAKLHLASRTQAAIYALRTGLVRLDEVDLG